MLLFIASYLLYALVELMFIPFLLIGIFGRFFGNYVGLRALDVRLTFYFSYFFSSFSSGFYDHLLTLFVGEGLVILVFPLLNARYLLLDLSFLI
jgi:hypothetical protein